MAKGIDKLTVAAIRNLKPDKHADGASTYLEVSADGSKYWRWKYRFGDKEKRLALGVYPEVSLAEARRKRDEAKALRRSGVDPSEARKQARSAAARAVSWRSHPHASQCDGGG